MSKKKAIKKLEKLWANNKYLEYEYWRIIYLTNRVVKPSEVTEIEMSM